MASRRRDKKDDESPPRHLDSAKLYIGNLSERVTDRELQETFQKYGTIRDCRVITETGSGRSKGFAFITFENPEDGSTAQQATHDQIELEGKRLIVEIARGGEKQTRRHEPYDKRGSRRDYDPRDRRDYHDPKYPDDRDRRDRPRGYPDLPPQWPPRDFPWYGRDSAYRDLPHFDRGDPFRRDDRDYRGYPPYPYPLPILPEDYYYDRRDRHRDYPGERHRDWDRDSRDRRDFPERDRRDYPNDTRDEGRRGDHPSTSRDRDYRKDDRYDRDSKDVRSDSHSTDRHRESAQDRRRS